MNPTSLEIAHFNAPAQGTSLGGGHDESMDLRGIPFYFTLDALIEGYLLAQSRAYSFFKSLIHLLTAVARIEVYGDSYIDQFCCLLEWAESGALRTNSIDTADIRTTGTKRGMRITGQGHCTTSIGMRITYKYILYTLSTVFLPCRND